MFIPPTLHKLFTDLNNSNRILIQQIRDAGLSGVQLIFPKGIKPTRNNVIDNDFVNIVVGGVNFFSRNPIQTNASEIDKILESYTEKDYYEVKGDMILDLLKNVGDIDTTDWNAKYVDCVQALIKQRPLQKFCLIVRRGRDISKGTGTLLSPTDRSIGERLKSQLTLTLYRVKGDASKDWNGDPFWIPNIKFPDGIMFYDMND